MRKTVNKRILALLIAVLMIVLCACSSQEKTQQEEETVETVEEVKTLDEIAVLFTGKMLGANKSEADFKTIKDRAEELRKQNIKVDIVDCGDYLSKDETGTEDVAASTLRAMSAAGYSHVLVNRHEFDFGVDGLRDFVASGTAKNMSCNFRYSGFLDDITAQLLRYDVVEIGNVKIGYVAVSDPDILEDDKDMFVEDGRIAYSFCGRSSSYLAEIVQSSIDSCIAEGADRVIVLSGINSSKKIGIMELSMMTVGVDAWICAYDEKSDTVEVYNGNNKATKIGCLHGGADSFGELRISPDGEITFSFR